MMDYVKKWFSLESEDSRKIVHVSSLLTVCTWPFFLENYGIYIICILFILINIYTKKAGMFKAVHTVRRATIGAEILPVGIMISTFFFLPENRTSFIYGILIVCFSDLMAELVGKKLKFYEYKIFGQKKSLGGSIAFFISTFLITSGMLIYLGTDIIISHVMIISVLLCLVEAVHTFGLDNFTLPVVSSIVFNFIHNMQL
tara:strand:- start:628 stop:1227 length:600 start_codon:yes stop_codon:yes gene_type:complete